MPIEGSGEEGVMGYGLWVTGYGQGEARLNFKIYEDYR